MIKIGIIGGSGLEDPNILEAATHHKILTPYGNPSSDLLEGKINGVNVVILSRHGKTHSIPPTQINNRANIYALKEIGCTHLIATTACGSLREDFKPSEFVIIDQFIDFTKNRILTYFDEFQGGELNHTAMAEPFDKTLRQKIITSAEKSGLKFHREGTVITIEGPRFSTRAESRMFQKWGADIINMSTSPEAILANELQIPYAAVAMITDYDSWNASNEGVTWEEVIRVFRANVNNVIHLLVNVIQSFSVEKK